ncbi:hypothetical protein BpHYR1_011338, partial [Brachionus plicatilis]
SEKFQASRVAVKFKAIQIKNNDLFSLFDISTSNIYRNNENSSSFKIATEDLNHLKNMFVISIEYFIKFMTENALEIFQKSKTTFRNKIFEMFDGKFTRKAKIANEFLYKYIFLEIFDFNSKQIICESIVHIFKSSNIVFDTNYALKVFVPEVMVQITTKLLNVRIKQLSIFFDQFLDNLHLSNFKPTPPPQPQPPPQPHLKKLQNCWHHCRSERPAGQVGRLGRPCKPVGTDGSEPQTDLEGRPLRSLSGLGFFNVTFLLEPCIYRISLNISGPFIFEKIHIIDQLLFE